MDSDENKEVKTLSQIELNQAEKKKKMILSQIIPLINKAEAFNITCRLFGIT